MAKSPRQAVEDEDDLLYGDSAPSLFSGAASAFVAKGFESSSNKTSKKESKRPSWTKYLTKIDVTHWAFGLRENGNLEILSLPDFTLTYAVNNFPLMPNMLVDALISTAARAAALLVLNLSLPLLFQKLLPRLHMIHNYLGCLPKLLDQRPDLFR